MKLFKPTSIIFMIIAAVLIVAGVILCFIGSNMADKQNILLFAESKDENGNSVSKRSLSGKSIKNIKLDFDKCDIYIIEDGEKNGVEFVNFAENAFEYALSNSELKIKDASLISSFKINESGTSFKGLRHYLVMPKYAKAEKQVKIYLSKDKISIADIEINLDNGNIFFENINQNCNYRINVKNGNVNITKTASSGACDIEIENGNLNFENNEIRSTKANIKLGNVNCNVASQHSLTCETDNGIVFLDGKNLGSRYQGTFPTTSVALENESKASDTEKEDDAQVTGKNEAETENVDDTEAETVKLPSVFFVKVKKGDITVNYKSNNE